MAACGAQACAEEKVDKPKRLFNYKPAGKLSPDYVPLPGAEEKYDTVEAYVAAAREGTKKIMEPMSKNPMFVEAMEKTIITELIVEKGKISDADITVYMHRPKALPKKGCPAMLFVHGGGAVSGRVFIPGYAVIALYYGVVGFNVDYRLAPEHGNKGSADVYAALKYVYENAEKLGIDKSRIGMEGSSAGSHHVFNAMNIMAQKGEKGICKMILTEIGMFTSVMRFTSEKEWKGEEVISGRNLNLMYQAMFGDKYKEHVDNKDPMLFPELVEEEKLKFYPPVAFFSAEFCPMHKGNQFFAQRLEEMGKLLEFRLIPGLGHMYGLANTKETMAVFTDRIKCVDTYLKN